MKTKALFVRITEAEKEGVVLAAKEAGVSVSSLIRSRVLGIEPAVVKSVPANDWRFVRESLGKEIAAVSVRHKASIDGDFSDGI